jgi:hypothetical protein
MQFNIDFTVRYRANPPSSTRIERNRANTNDTKIDQPFYMEVDLSFLLILKAAVPPMRVPMIVNGSGTL